MVSLTFQQCMVVAVALMCPIGMVAADDPSECNSWSTRCPMTLGEPAVLPAQNGNTDIQLDEGAHQFFQLENVPKNADFVLSMTVFFGDPDLFVTIDGRKPSTDAPYSSVARGERDVLRIPHADLQGCPEAGCTISIDVLGYATSLYRLVATSENGFTELADGVPQRDSVSIDEYNYFKFTVPAQGEVSNSLTITVTPLSGDPDVVVSHCVRPCDPIKPTRAVHEWQQQAWGGDTITIDESQHNTEHDTDYFIGVYGYNNATTFTIVAQLDANIALADGQPQEGEIPAHGSRYYHLFTAGAADKSITITLTPQQGDVSLYVTSQADGAATNVPSPQHFQWSSTGNWYSTETVVIHPGDDGFLSTRGQYNIEVLANTDAQFSLVANSEGAVVSLRDGIPQTASVSPGEYVYFQFHVDDPSQNIAIDVTPLNGDPDVFVDCAIQPTGDDTGTPSRSANHYKWKSENWGHDSVLVSHDDPAGSCAATATGPNGGTFYIAVLGFSNTTFTILGSMDDGLPTLLVDGAPQQGTVVAGAYKMYEFEVGEEAPELTITLTPIFGDPDLYVNINGRMASRTDYTFRSQFSRGKDYIFIEAADMCTSCFVSIAVYGYQTSSYTIAATTGGALRTLQDGVSVRDFVQHNEYEYFQFTVPEGGHTLEITCTVVSGDPDLYVSHTEHHPTAQTPNTIAALHYGDDRVVVQNADAGKWYIAVRGWTNTSFTLVAHVRSGEGEAMQRLTIGQPQTGQVAPNSFEYYQLIVDDFPRALSFTATPLEGSITFFVNYCGGPEDNNRRWDECDGGREDGNDADRRPRINPETHAFENYVWASTHSVSRESVRITVGSEHVCSQCSYIVGVYGGAEGVSSFSLTATNTDDLVMLQDGVPFRDYVDQYQHEYFVFSLLDEHADVIISVTPFTGDPDVYVTACGMQADGTVPPTCAVHPTNTSYTWAHRSYGADTLAINWASEGACVPSAEVSCDFYIGVYGFTASSFSIMAYLHDNRPIVLVDGVPQSGMVNQSISEQYLLYVEPGHTDIEITLTPRFGDADLYVLTSAGDNPADDRIPSPTVYDYRSIHASGDDHVHIGIGDSNNHCTVGVSCRVHIAVHGYRPSQYTIVASSSHATTTLQTGVPMRDTVPQDTYEYFVFTADQPNTIITIALTPISGDPDIYVSTGDLTTTPTSAAGQSFWRGSRLGSDVIEIPPDDENACAIPCNYYIGVKAYGADAEFSLLAVQRSDSPITLVDGVPQEEFVNKSMTNQYQITVDTHDMQTVEVTLTPFFGDADLYATVDGHVPGPHNRQYYSLASSGEDSITVSASDQAWIDAGCTERAICQIRIAVYGYTNSRYSIVANTQNEQIVLQDGVAFRGRVGANQYAYFVYNNRAFSNAVAITLTPLSGDPDMYVDTHPLPTSQSGHHQWSANRLGLDVVDIMPDDPHACTPPCNYYIGILGWAHNATFTIMASNHSGLPTPLVDGVPQMGRVDEGRVNRYYFDMTAEQQAIELSVTPLYGDPDLYVAVDGDPPSRTHSNYASLVSNGEDVLVINASDPIMVTHCSQNWASRATCRVHIAVYGYQTAEYTLTVSGNTGMQHLVEGVPSSDVVAAGEYSYFVFNLLRPDSAVTFQLTPLSGDPDLFASTTVHRPTMLEGHYTWVANTLDDDIITIQPDDPRGCNGQSCAIYLGVYGFSGSSSFTLTATVAHDDRVDTLTAGMPVRAHAEYFEMNYFKFRVGNVANDHVEFLITQLAGVVETFVSVVHVTSNTATDSRDGWPVVHCSGVPGPDCTVEHAMWSSSNSLSRSRVYIPHVDSNFCAGTECLYVVGVMSKTRSGSDFSIVGASGHDIITLQDGVPQEGAVFEGQYEHYRVIVSEEGSDLMLTLTPFSGDPDMYVSETVPRPTRDLDGHTWHSISFQQDTLTIQYHDLEHCEQEIGRGGQCEVYVAIYGYTNTSYSLVPSLDQSSNRPVVLIDGVPQQGRVDLHQYRYYIIHVNELSAPLTITATPSTGDSDLYVTTDNTVPGRYHYAFSSTVFGGEDTITINPTDANACDNCNIMIAVFGYTEAQYAITYSLGSSITRLQDGVPHAGRVGNHEYVYYEFGVDAPDEDVTISVTPNGGDPDLFVRVEDPDDPLSDANRPSQHNYQWAGLSYGNDVVIIRHDDPHACFECNYLIAVYGSRNSTYSITATASADTMIALRDGQPQLNFVEQDQYKYYTLHILSNTASVTFRTETLSSGSNVEMYVTNLYRDGDPPQGELPTSAHYLWSTSGPEATSRNTITIRKPIGGWASHLRFTIGVKGVAYSRFTITASTAEQIQALVSGTPSTNHQLLRGETQHFSFNLDRPDANVYFRVSPTVGGDPDLLVSTRYPNPGCAFSGNSPAAHCSNYTWISQASQGDDLLTISHAEPCQNAARNSHCDPSIDWGTGRFYIGVFAFRDSTFTITAGYEGEHTTLIDGSSQRSSTGAVTICQQRDDVNGACLAGQSPPPEHVEGAFFSFTTGGGDGYRDSDIIVRVKARCEDGADDCAELDFYVTACQASACLMDTQYPYIWNQDFAQPSPSSNNIFIRQDDPQFCSAANGELCNYYVGVYARCRTGNVGCEPVEFDIEYVTDTGIVQLREDCLVNHICKQPTAALVDTARFYELYAPAPTGDAAAMDMTVHVEACAGHPSLYVCHSHCSHPFEPAPPTNYQWKDEVAPASGVASIRVPEASDVYYMSVRGVDTAPSVTYELWAASGDVRVLQPADAPSMKQVTDHSVTLQWDAPTMLTTVSGTTSDAPSGITYEVYSSEGTFPEGTMITPCGMQAFKADGGQAAGTTLSATIGGLDSFITYSFVVVAHCTGGCDGTVFQGGEQTVAYPVMTATTLESTMGGGTLFAIILLAVLVPGIGAVCFVYRRNKQRERQLQYHMVETDDMEGVVSQPVVGYRGYDDDEAEPRPLAERVAMYMDS